MFSPPRRWALVLTPPDQRKRDEVFTIAKRLAEQGLRVAGFAQRRSAGATRSYALHSLVGDDLPVPLARRGGSPGPGEEPYCNCVFRPDAFTTGRAWLARDLPGCDLAIIDELSRLEASGGGHADAVVEALDRAPLTVLSIRADRLSVLMERFGLAEPIAVLEQGDPPDAFLAAVVDSLRAAPTFDARRSSPSTTETP